MSQISAIETKLKQLKDGDDRLSQVIDQLLRLTREIEELHQGAKTMKDRLARLGQ
jgi:predicted CopG family antitoxin